MTGKLLHLQTAAQKRREWALMMMRRATGPVPEYGSPEFLATPDGSLERVASIIRAAECWALDGEDVEENLRLEQETMREVGAKLDEDAAFVEAGTEHQKRWEPIAEVIGRRGRRYPR